MPENSSSNPAPVPVDLPLEQRLAAAAERYGHSEFVERVLNLIKGYDEGDDLLLFVGGDHAQGILDGAPVLYWPELWGTRALLYVWDESAAPAVIGTLGNPAWRVREMGARVVAAHELPAVSELAGLLGDGVARVRSAAARSLEAVGALEDVDRLLPLLKDPEIDVRRSAQQSIDALRARFPKD
ncbi:MULTISPECIES: HEAT repeat domain-containing protein [unclassified Pseudoclavibacter]|uniref:HEAT repeat domain-containing protein n=1 Tax=unclassified Pseudoclavibacter TaxID=2615177 RepID=UPI0020163985|nr:HEAT repeat domain-containing protein [Pseudoclavibacter sp. Marseille-Q4354]